MSDPNLPSDTESASDDRILIGGRVAPEEAQLVDMARVVGGFRNRNDFVVAAVMEKTRSVLKRQRSSDERRAS
jgi:uncharacterized protein (DUF1778 family)